MTLRCKHGSKHHMQPSLDASFTLNSEKLVPLSLICYYQCNSSISISRGDKKQKPEEDRIYEMVFYWLGIPLIVD